MSKNKARTHQKRKQKKALSDARRRASKPSRKPPKTPPGPSRAEFPESERTFWMLHGINYLHSDYTEGVWDPLFPEIYDGTEPAEETITQRLSVVAKQEPTARQLAILGYAFQGRQTHYVFKANAERILSLTEDKSPEQATQPHQPLVWQMFHDEIMVKAMTRTGETE